jgi:hypothetical protein
LPSTYILKPSSVSLVKIFTTSDTRPVKYLIVLLIAKSIPNL